MRVLLDRLKGFAELLLLAVMLVSWGSSDAVAQFFNSPGGGTGGFTGRPLITVEISASSIRPCEPPDNTKTCVSVNLAGFGPNPSLPYTSTLTAVVKQDGRLFPTNIQFDLAPNLAQGALFDPADLTQGFRSLPLASTSGLATAFFQASSTPGTVTITASAQDPNTGQTVSSSVQITVVAEARPATSMTFTGPYVNAVLAGQSRFALPDGTPVQNGAYSRVVSVVVNDANGNPTNPNTKINFFLIDGPITGYPTNPGSFVIAGADGDPQEGGLNFSALGGQFLTKGVRPLDRLVLSGVQLFRTVQTVTSETSLTIQSTRPFGLENRTAIPYVIGHPENGAILSPSFTDLNGVASTTLTYPVTRVGQTAILMACTDDYLSCGVLNTCDANGANCKSVYLGATNGSDWVLTTSATELGPNTTTPVKLCLKDPNFTPLAATAIRYDMSTVGVAKVKVNGVEGKQGQVLTGGDGCATVTIQSSGQPPGSQDIVLSFIADNIPADSAVKITIKGPGEGKIDGVATCQVTSAGSNKGDPPTPPTATCSVQMQLVDDNFSPLAGVLVTVGDGSAPDGGVFSVAFSPAEGKFGKTDDKGALAATVNFTGAGAFSIPFKVLNGTATYTLKFNVPAPTDKADDDGATTTDPLTISTTTLAGATTGTFYTALLQAAGGKTPYTWSILSGVLPAGLSLNSSTGVLSGTPTAPGTFNFVAKVTDSAGATALANLALLVTQPGGGGGGSATPSSLILLVNSPDLPSSGQQPATLTAIARDGTGVLLKDVSVQFKVKSTETDGVTPNGTIQVITSVTDESGVATASLSTGGNKRNRTITVGASSGAVNANDLVINVTGTTLNVSGVSSGASVLLGDTVKLIFQLNDSGGTGIAGAKLNVVSALNGLAIPPATSNDLGSSLIVTTNTSGVAEVNLKINQNGQDTINATWEGNASSATTTTLPLTLSASPDSFVITVKDNLTNVADVVGIDSFGNVEVTWLKNGAPVVGAAITLNTTKGTLSLTQGITDAQGKLTGITIQSSVPGGAVITATGTKTPDTVTTQKTIQFGATTPSQLTLQASPSTLAVNVPPATASQSTIVATLRDVNDNPVPNQTVTFAVTQDTSGGTLTAATAKTDFSGQASVVYIAGSSPTKENGVRIMAAVGLMDCDPLSPPQPPPANPNPVCKVVTLTVSKREVFITLGTGNTITEPDPTTYALPYNVLVNDIVGGAVQGATVTLDTVPSQYRKGQYVWNGVVWVPVVAVSCNNEDANNNGILDPGEDVNNNARLDPGNVVTPSVAAITTDKDGFGKFDVLYAQQYANWINNVLTARTKVGGSEDQESALFVLPPSAADVGNEKVSPPGQPSPFGVLPNCQVNVDQEANMTLTAVPGTIPPGVPTNPPTPLSLALGIAAIPDNTLSPGQSVSGTVTVVVNVPNLPVGTDLTGTSIVTDTNSIVANVDITTASILQTTGSQALFTVTVTNPSTTEFVPVSAAGTSVGSLTFTVGNAKVVMSVILKPQP